MADIEKQINTLNEESPTPDPGSVLPTQGFGNVVLEQIEITKPNLSKLKSLASLITKKGNMTGAYWRGAQGLPVNQVAFNDQSYVPSSSNSNIDGNIRRDAGPNMLGFTYHMPSYLKNIKQFRIDVLSNNAPYIGNQLNMSYPDAVSGEAWLKQSVELYEYNLIAAQYTFENWDGTYTKSFSIFDLIALAVGDGTAKYSIDQVKANLAGTTNTSNVVVYTPSDTQEYNYSWIEAIGQYKTLEEYIQNPNSFFLPKNYSATNAVLSTSATPQYANTNSIIKVCTPKFMESLKVFNYAIYKEWTEEQTTGKLVVLPLTSFSTGNNIGTSTVAPLNQFDYTLTDSQVLLFNKDSFIQMSYPIVESTKEFFVNNITDSKFANVCTWNTYTIDGAVAIFDFGTVVNSAQ